jgi:S1-C subfamily serine protease
LDARHITHLIQTDAPIKPGNSGGPLLNGAGQVVGINTMCCPMMGQRSGMNLAIPSDLAQTVVTQLVNGGAVVRGFIGIQIGDDLSADFARHFGGKTPGGVSVDSVFLDSPAQRAGVHEADVILAINDVPISNHHHARTLIDTARPGNRMKIKCWRRQKQGLSHQEGREIDFILMAVGLPEGKWAARSRNALWTRNALWNMP